MEFPRIQEKNDEKPMEFPKSKFSQKKMQKNTWQANRRYLGKNFLNHL